jgi:hypothetical protein
MSFFKAFFPVLMFAGPAVAAEFDVPPAEAAASSLPAELAAGPDFHVTEPVLSDGLMHHYVIDSRFGTFAAYGIEALKIRVREIAALTQIAKTTDINVIVKSVTRGVKGDVETVQQVTLHPVNTVVGIPKGIKHLFGGAKAQAGEVSDQIKKQGKSVSSGSSAPSSAELAKSATKNAAKYADRYLGVSKAETRYFAQLNVDPYTNNLVLKKAVHHLAQVDAATSLGMHFVGVPGLPYIGDAQRAMNAIYHEDPAVLRAQQRAVLKDYGLTPEEINRYENQLLLSPTRQSLLAEDAKSLEGVAGRDELFRHAMAVTTEEEMQVFLQSCQLLARVHAQRPLQRILAGLRVPTALTADGHVLVVGAFDSVYWTEDVARYGAELRGLLPADVAIREVWLSGPASSQAQSELRARGWEVHDNAAKSLPVPAPAA